jgi:hypothetical protein
MKSDPPILPPTPPLDEGTREAALIAVLADIVERTCVIEERPAVLQSPPSEEKPAKAA